MKIKKGDTVKIARGKDRGKTGKVLRVEPNRERVVVEGVNLMKRHIRPKRRTDKGQIMEMVMPIDFSNVRLVCPKCSMSTRVAYVVSDTGTKERKCKKCNAVFA